MFVEKALIPRILCLAFHNDMLFPAYQYIIVAGGSINLAYSNISIGEERLCTVSDMNSMQDKLIILSFKSSAIDSSSSNDKLSQYHNMFSSHPDGIGYFDAILSLALAANNSRNVLTLSNYSYGLTYETDILRREILKLDFKGLSGRIRFDNTTGRVIRNICIQQLYNNSKHLITLGTYDHENGIIHTTGNGQFLNSEIPIRERIDTFETVPLFLSILALVAISLLLLIVLTLHILTLIYRKSESVKASSPMLSNIAFLGCYLIVLSLIVNVMIEGFTNYYNQSIRCHLFHVMNSSVILGSTLIESLICVKTWRLYRIFVHYKNPGCLLADRILIIFIIICAIIVTAVSVAWISFDPLKITLHRMQEDYIDISPNLQGLLDVTVVRTNVYRCLQEVPFHFYFWIFSLTIFVIILSLASVILGILATKAIKSKKFKTDNVVVANFLIIGLGLIVAGINVLLVSVPNTTEIDFSFLI